MDKIDKAVNQLLGESSDDKDRMIDRGISLLSRYKDSVDKVMDYLLSEYGGRLDDEEWGEVEQELNNYVDNLEDD